MTAALAVLLAALAGWLFPAARPPVRERLRALTPAARRAEGTFVRHAVAAAVALACVLYLGGPAGWCGAALAAVACEVLMSRLEPASVRERRARIQADLPLAIDLLAACLLGGTSWGLAVAAVAEALDGPLGEELAAVAAQVSLGADPADAWLTLAADPVLAPLARTVARATQSGASLSTTLTRLADDHRRTAQSAALARARAAGVRAVAPLGLCFLPAFVLLGIVPAIAGVAASLHFP